MTSEAVSQFSKVKIENNSRHVNFSVEGIQVMKGKLISQIS